MRGSPIRKSSDQRSVDSSPRLIAASYVLHRLLVPRHPPCALNNLATQKHRTPTPGRKRACGPTRTLLIRVLKMLASTVQFSTYDQTPATRPHQTSDPHGDHSGMRCRPALQDNDHPKPSSRGPLSQDPTACLRTGSRHPDSGPRTPAGVPYWEPATRAGRTGQRSTLEHHPTHSAVPRE